jgi:hypothetical protein
MTQTITAYAVLRPDGTVKEHVLHKSLAIFTSAETAKAVIQSGTVVPCTITYEK